MIKETPLELTATWSQLQKISTLAFNALGGIKVRGNAESVRDTDFTYSLYVEGKLTKEKMTAVYYFCRGVIACCKSY